MAGESLNLNIYLQERYLVVLQIKTQSNAHCLHRIALKYLYWSEIQLLDTGIMDLHSVEG